MTTLAILGRPNVGKSTLFNRLTGKQHALTHDLPGVTRDRREGKGELAGLEFTLVDTAGLEESKTQTLTARMTQQSLKALELADIGLFVIDGRAGITSADEEYAKQLRRYDKPIVLVVNKAEGSAANNTLLDAYRLGFGEPVALSAAHGEGLADLYRAIAPHFPENDGGEALETDTEHKPIQLAIIGRPNAGKSTLINALLGEERVLTGPEAGITRDAIAVPFTYKGQAFTLVDTAGMRRKANVTGQLEKMAVDDTLRAIQYAEIVILMIDATQLLERQDLAIASLIEREGRAMIIAINKWDQIEDGKLYLLDIEERLAEVLPQLRGIPFVPISALNKTGFGKLIGAAMHIHKLWNTRVSTGQLNRWLEEALSRHSPPQVKGKRLKFRYLSQTKTRPPTFYIASNMTEKQIPESYLRYLLNDLRDSFNLPGVPIRFMLRKSANPYSGKRD